MWKAADLLNPAESETLSEVEYRSLDSGLILKAAYSSFAKRDASHFEDFDNLCFVNNFNEPAMLHILRTRYFKVIASVLHSPVLFIYVAVWCY
jgi:hypothetical protein